MANESPKHLRGQRAKGIARREKILTVTRTMLSEGKINSLTLAELAKASDIPVSSLYHFYPTIDEVYADLIDVFRHELARYLEAQAVHCEADNWQSMVDWIIELSISFYQQHPEFEALILSGQAKPAVKAKDRGSDQMIAKQLIEAFDLYFALPQFDQLDEVVFIALEIVDLILGLSVQQRGHIEKEFGVQAKIACKAYLRSYLPEILPSRPASE